MVIEKVVAGVVTPLAGATIYDYDPITFQVVGNVLSVYTNQSLQLTVTDSSITAAGRPGLYFAVAGGVASTYYGRVWDFTVPVATPGLYVKYTTPRSGGVQAAGSVAPVGVAPRSASGGVQSGGSSAPALAYGAVPPSGGVQAAGSSAPAGVGGPVVGSGGIQIGASPGPGFGAYDTFTDASGTPLPSHVPDSGGVWTEHVAYPSAVITITPTNTIALTTGTPGMAYHSSTPLADTDVSGTFVLASGQGNNNLLRVSLVGRLSTTANTCYRASVGDKNFYTGSTFVPGVGIEKVVGGTLTVLGSTVRYNGGVLTLRMVGSTISILEDGVTIASVTDSSIPGPGRSGVYFFGTSTYTGGGQIHMEVDNFASGGDPGRLWSVYGPSASGGVQAAGSTATITTWLASASGGVQAGGLGAQVATYALVPESGVQVGGFVNYVAQSAGKPGGGIQTSGSAVPFKVFGYAPTGGVQVAGSGNLGNAFVVIVSGGIQASGSGGGLQFTYGNRSTGGMEAAGYGGLTKIYPYVGTGGVQSAGSFVAVSALHGSVSGGVQISAMAMANPASGGQYTVAASGGVQVAGHGAIPGFTYQIYANAGDGGVIYRLRPFHRQHDRTDMDVQPVDGSRRLEVRRPRQSGRVPGEEPGCLCDDQSGRVRGRYFHPTGGTPEPDGHPRRRRRHPGRLGLSRALAGRQRIPCVRGRRNPRLRHPGRHRPAWTPSGPPRGRPDGTCGRSDLHGRRPCVQRDGGGAEHGDRPGHRRRHGSGAGGRPDHIDRPKRLVRG